MGNVIKLIRNKQGKLFLKLKLIVNQIFSNNSLLLDNYPNASAAYSLRKLRTDYEGDAIEVRIDTATTPQPFYNIGFDSNGNLDTADLLSKAGSNDAYVAVWYDQSGTNNNMIQNSASAQPQIVDQGSIITKDSKPCVKFVSSNILVASPVASIASCLFSFYVITSARLSTATVHSVLRTNDTQGTTVFLDLRSNPKRNLFVTNGSKAADLSTVRATTNTRLLSSYGDGNSNIFAFDNGATGGTSSIVSPFDNDNLQMSSTSLVPLDGNITELIVYPTDTRSNRKAIETNINNYYSIYPKALDFNPYNIWDSEHISINNTTTTLTDFNAVGTAYDLVNPAASNQPTYTSADSNFSGLPSLTFDGTGDYVRKTVSGYRPLDTSGVFVSVYRLISGIQICDITVSDTNSTNKYVFNQINTDTLRLYILNGEVVSFRGSTNINNTNSQVIAYGTSGSVYKQWVGTTAQTINMISGDNNGSVWFANGDNYNNLTIGALERTSLAFSNMAWCMSGYFPYVDDETTLSLITALKNKYIDATVVVDPILAFNPYNVWSSENVIIDGTETTFLDFNNVSDGASYNLVNPAATNQPSYNASDSDFNNLPSFTFDGDDYLINEVSDYRISDNSGMMVCVIKRNADQISPILSFGAGAGTLRMTTRTTTAKQLQFIKLGGDSGNRFSTTSDTINNTEAHVLVIASTGTSYKMFINEENVTFNNTDDGKWLSDYASGNLNNVSIGASVSGSIIAANANIAMTGYFPYVDDATTINLISLLKTKYGIN